MMEECIKKRLNREYGKNNVSGRSRTPTFLTIHNRPRPDSRKQIQLSLNKPVKDEQPRK